jgi:uncharacterized protein YggE
MRRYSMFPAMAVLAAGLALSAAPAMADNPRTLSVTGEGEMRGVPNQAQISAGVVTNAKTAGEALAANSKAMGAVFATLKKFGIPDKSMQTSGFSVSPQYPPDRDGSDGAKIVGYQVSNDVFVTVDDLHKLGPALDALVASGANNIGGISFTIRDPKPLMAQARAAAVQDAIARAQTYAKAAGQQLGAILSIQESSSDYPRPMAMAGMMRAAASVPVAAGEQSITANVSVTWALR